MKTSTETVARVFDTLSPEDIERVNSFLRDLGVLVTVWDPLVRLHCQLAVAAVIEEVRTLELGARVLTSDEKETLEALLKMQ